MIATMNSNDFFNGCPSESMDSSVDEDEFHENIEEKKVGTTTMIKNEMKKMSIEKRE